MQRLGREYRFVNAASMVLERFIHTSPILFAAIPPLLPANKNLR
jgi:hypothetical protein